MAFQNKEQYIKESYERSAVIVTILIISAIILLMVSYWIIQRDIRAKERAKRKQEKLINKLHRSLNENDELLDARRQTLQTIIHELRSPLTAICGNIELIATDHNPEERIRHIQIIQFSVGRMSSMLGDLMNYFRLDNGKEQVCPQPFRLKCITNTLRREFLPLMEKKSLAFNIDACENEIVTGDKNMILRIGSNLLSNAVKFTERGNITLRTAYSNGVFTLEVSDTGCGITEQQREKIFCPFERLTNAATQDGFGLGLPIVKELVTLMEGKIYVESMTGSGSRFTVCIPLSKADEGFVEKDDILDDFKNLQDTSVLILDNDPVQLTMTRDMSVRYGIGCDTCRNVDELLNMMRERKYDLLITDMKMPDMNGYEVLELLRSSDIATPEPFLLPYLRHWTKVRKRNCLLEASVVACSSHSLPKSCWKQSPRVPHIKHRSRKSICLRCLHTGIMPDLWNGLSLKRKRKWKKSARLTRKKIWQNWTI